jgi:uncharacterized membrane protein
MKSYLLLGAACAALAIAPALAVAQEHVSTTTTENADGSTTTTTKDVKKNNTGTVGGAAGGAVAGAVVAGPIGAVVGGIAGATIGHSVAPPTEVRTYVTTQTVDPIAYQGQVELGKPVAGSVAWRDVPGQPRYHWARLNDERVVVDDNHNVVAIYTN